MVAMKKKREESDARVPSASAAAITTNWQDAMTGGGGQQISHGHGDHGTPTNQHSASSSTDTNIPKGLRRSVSFADKVDILAEAEDVKPPASTSPCEGNADADNEEKIGHDRGDDEGYEKFLALLASSPALAPAQAPTPSSPSTSSMTLSLSMSEHDPRRVSLP